MRITTRLFLPILLLSLSHDAVAQSSGMFGPRNLGQSLRPGVSQFDSGLQISPGGSFIGSGRPTGQNDFARPWRQVPQPPIYVPNTYAVLPDGRLVGIVPGQNVSSETESPVANSSQMSSQRAVALETMAQSEASASQPFSMDEGFLGQDASFASSAAALTPSGATPNNLNFRPRRPVQYGFPATTPSGEFRGYLPRVSERMTRLARDHGIQVSSAIRVSVVNGTAIIRGTVGSPGDRSLIANMVAMEPGIGRVSNQMTVVSEQTAPAK